MAYYPLSVPMKYFHFLLAAAGLWLASCNEGNQSKGTVKDTVASAIVPPTEPLAWAQGPSCYKAISGKDSVLLHLVITGNTATGDLAYSFFEKDDNTGTLSGELRGDTLFAEYTFQSEGQQSVREVALLRRADALVEGFGPVKDTAGKMVFVNRSALEFKGSFTYNAISCAPDKHGCPRAVGYRWSALKNACIRPAQAGIRLKALEEAGPGSEPAFVVFSEDSARGELFLPQAATAVVLQRKGTEGTGYWEGGEWKLYPWKGYVLKRGDKALYGGQ